jgi:hypothetical protein
VDKGCHGINDADLETASAAEVAESIVVELIPDINTSEL